MGKLTWIGQVPPDDPLFSSGPEMFSRYEFRASSTSSPRNTGGDTPVGSKSPSRKKRSRQDERGKTK